MADTWNVFRCLACNNCHGRKTSGHSCPHCGQRIGESTPVVDKAANPGELRMKVILANTPPELRDSLAKQLKKAESLVQSALSFNPKKGVQILRESLDSDGILSLSEVQKNFTKKGFEKSVIAFLEMAEAEGLILRLDEGLWQFLE
ncbi:MAG TPA: hypothetical protein D7H99_01995 [Candidatus Poseidoniales archaeon]|nr:hypothetical protein [Euryarchaeota archaeon]DAC28650.1 MAG TPA: hypothetical protein D7H99_01995 [Candidatus Poseidoniales archaeon]HII57706.1 hypothetical protein [Candidatus Poseidoniaceae archaeon]|tara:strand:+ start:209 stop:646 length:438 start_codon:yes stop_codon:yes gene_type:complete